MRPDLGRDGVAPRFAENLKSLRRERRLSQEDMAWRSGLHRTQISLLERGNRLPEVTTVLALAGALEVSIDDLFDGISFEPIVAISGGFSVTPTDSMR